MKKVSGRLPLRREQTCEDNFKDSKGFALSTFDFRLSKPKVLLSHQLGVSINIDFLIPAV